MPLSQKTVGILIGIAIVLGVFLFFFRHEEPPPSPTPKTTLSAAPPTPSAEIYQTPLPSPTPDPTRYAASTSIKSVSPAFNFGFYIPREWEAEAVKQIESINIYDPRLPGGTNLEKSQIFIRYFRANNFLTLPSVKVLSRKEVTVAEHPAIDYIIEKKPGYPNFPRQPLWRNQKHRVTDVRTSDASQAVFYVFAKHPDLDDILFESILGTLKISPEPSLP